MKTSILFFTLLISAMLTAQTKVTVIVVNGSFTPANLTITVGDTVEWVNQSGFHWVDGRQVTYPSNPVSFDNQSQSGSGWTYTQVFNTSGSYDYRCGIHTTTMFGTIIVQVATGVFNPTKANEIDFYPNPSSQNLTFPNYKNIEKVILYSVTGKKVLESELVKNNLNISSLTSGAYFVKSITNEGETTKKLIIE